MPSANTLPDRTRLAAFTISSGVTWLRVPTWSFLPHRPQLFSFSVASAIAFLPTLMFMKSFLPTYYLFAASKLPQLSNAILHRASVFHQAGCVIRILTEPVAAAHDPRPRGAYQSFRENIHETQSIRHDCCADGARGAHACDQYYQ